MFGLPLDDVLMGARFLRDLPGFLRHPVELSEARAVLQRRLEGRTARFLDIVGALFRHDGPYRGLFRAAGCRPGDVEDLARREGVEGALAALFRSGVYLTTEEFKGRRPVVRGTSRVEADPAWRRNPRARGHVPTTSGGSRGAPTDVHVDLEFIRDRAVDLALHLEARRPAGRPVDWRHAFWSVPGGTALARILEYRGVGGTVDRWFTQLDPAGPGLAARYRWSARLLQCGSLLAGQRRPRVQFVPLDDPLPIVHYLRGVVRSGALPHLHTYVSPAVRLARAALDAGLDLEGARLTVTGEPVTASRRRLLEQAGAEVWPRYGTSECSLIGYGCLSPVCADDVHVFHDLYAVIQAQAGNAAGLPAAALLVSTLCPTAPLLLLNLSLGDQGTLERRPCDCPLARSGWPTHLSAIRSFEKLTAGGVTLMDTDVVRVLEEILPTRFGGAPTDYQLVEEEDATGRPVVRLLVHPRVGPLDDSTVTGVFLEAIGAGTGAERVMSLAWRDAKLLRVERRPPIPTASGKILHLHVGRPPGQGGPQGGT